MREKLLATLLLVALLSFKGYSQDYAAAVKASTLGVTVEGIRSFGPMFNGRLGVSFFSYKLDGGGDSGDDYKFDATLNLQSVSLLADYFPFENFFRITGGLIINLNKLDLKMSPNKTYTVGSTLYTPALLGNMKAKVDMNKVSPYIGIGFDNPTAGSGLGFTMEIGGIYQGAPKVSLEAEGLLKPSESQAPIIEDNLSWFKFYPVINLGLTYKF